jgi:transcription elongation factor Elf1
MRKAIKNVAAWWFNCPYCSYGLECPIGGSLMWTEEDLTDDPVMCRACGKSCEIPKVKR